MQTYIIIILFLDLLQFFGAEIPHFIVQLYYYINFEVLDCALENIFKRVHSTKG